MGTVSLLNNLVPGFSLLAEGQGPTYGFSWGLILLAVILGLLVTLKSSGRKTEVKKRGGTFDQD